MTLPRPTPLSPLAALLCAAPLFAGGAAARPPLEAPRPARPAADAVRSDAAADGDSFDGVFGDELPAAAEPHPLGVIRSPRRLEVRGVWPVGGEEDGAADGDAKPESPAAPAKLWPLRRVVRVEVEDVGVEDVEEAPEGRGVATPRLADGENLAEPEPEAAPADPLVELAGRAIRVTRSRILSGDAHTPWQIGHGVMALRDQYILDVGGRRVSGLEWIAAGPSFRGTPWFVRTRYGGKATPYNGTPYEFEGHPNQILAFLAMSHLPPDTRFRAGDGGQFTLEQWINNAKAETRVDPREEVAWTLWAFSVYLDPDAQWRNLRGEWWNMERLIQAQLATPAEKSACGGMHGLYALASARNARLQGGGRLDGQWRRAHMEVERRIEMVRAMRNRDGSLSSNYFKGRGYTDDVVKRISTSGHTLEFLMMALPQRRLDEPWVRSAVERVATDLLEGRNAPMGGKQVGGMYHAVHALVLHRERTAPVEMAAAPDGRVVR